jgi:hypothetical protein
MFLFVGFAACIGLKKPFFLFLFCFPDGFAIMWRYIVNKIAVMLLLRVFVQAGFRFYVEE